MRKIITTKANMILYMVFVILYLYLLRNYNMGDAIANIRYYALVGIIVFGTFSIMFLNYDMILKKKLYFLRNKELLLSLIIGTLFLILSLIKANSVHMQFNFRTIVQIFLFLLPTVYAFVALNIFSKKEIIRIFQLSTITLIIVYFTESNHTLLKFFNIENLKSISFLKSTSFTESHLCARSFTILFLIFYYLYRTQPTKENLIFLIINSVFSILCFKRIDILIVMLTLVFGRFFDFRKQIKFKTIVLTALFILFFTILYKKFLEGSFLSNLNAKLLTSGRNVLLLKWKDYNYFSYGYGTSMFVINRYLELDLIQIYMELNVIALFLFVFCYMFFSRKSIYSYYIMLYVILNMLLASSLANTLSWTILMLSIGLIVSDSDEAKKELS